MELRPSLTWLSWLPKSVSTTMARVSTIYIDPCAGQIPPEGAIPFPEFPGTPNHAFFDDFDAQQQLVSVSGDHEFRLPGPNDIRGPCAGLNAAANHGYIPRDGIATFESINTGLWEAFSLDNTATIFLNTATSCKCCYGMCSKA